MLNTTEIKNSLALALDSDDIAQAELYLTKLEDLDSDDREIPFLKALFHEKAGDLQQAADQYETASKLFPDATFIQFRIIELSINRQDYDKAEYLIQQLESAFTNNAQLSYLKAYFFKEKGDYAAALSAISDIREDSEPADNLAQVIFEKLKGVNNLSDSYATLIKIIQAESIGHELSFRFLYSDMEPFREWLLGQRPSAIYNYTTIIFKYLENADKKEIGKIRPLLPLYALVKKYGIPIQHQKTSEHFYAKDELNCISYLNELEIRNYFEILFYHIKLFGLLSQRLDKAEATALYEQASKYLIKLKDTSLLRFLIIKLNETLDKCSAFLLQSSGPLTDHILNVSAFDSFNSASQHETFWSLIQEIDERFWEPCSHLADLADRKGLAHEAKEFAEAAEEKAKNHCRYPIFFVKGKPSRQELLDRFQERFRLPASFKNEKNVLVSLHFHNTGGLSLLDNAQNMLGYSNYIVRPVGTKEEQLDIALTSINGSTEEMLRLPYLHFGYPIHRETSLPTKYISILRHPVRNFFSNYYFVRKSLQDNSPFVDKNAVPRNAKGDFVSLREHVENCANTSVNGQYFMASNDLLALSADPARNLEEFYRGWNKIIREASSDVDRHLAYIKDVYDNHYALMGITELFDESVFALNAILGNNRISTWQPGGSSYAPALDDLDPALIDTASNFLSNEIAVYEYLRGEFEKKIEGLGLKIQEAFGSLKYIPSR